MVTTRLRLLSLLTAAIVVFGACSNAATPSSSAAAGGSAAASTCAATGTAAGATDLADDYDASEPERARSFTTRALRLTTYADELAAAAGLWRRDALT